VAEIDAAMSGQEAPCPACNRLLIVPHAAVPSRLDSAPPLDSVVPPALPGNETIVPPPPPFSHSPPPVESASTSTLPSEAAPPEIPPPWDPNSTAIASDATMPPPLPTASHASNDSSGAAPETAYFAPQTAPLAPSVVGGRTPAAANDSAREEISLQEKSRRKVRRNLAMLACGLAILLLALGLLLRLSGD
jgi:hypothetical protein